MGELAFPSSLRSQPPSLYIRGDPKSSIQKSRYTPSRRRTPSSSKQNPAPSSFPSPVSSSLVLSALLLLLSSVHLNERASTVTELVSPFLSLFLLLFSTRGLDREVGSSGWARRRRRRKKRRSEGRGRLDGEGGSPSRDRDGQAGWPSDL